MSLWIVEMEWKDIFFVFFHAACLLPTRFICFSCFFGSESRFISKREWQHCLRLTFYHTVLPLRVRQDGGWWCCWTGEENYRFTCN